jgi:hypothetical protein
MSPITKTLTAQENNKTEPIQEEASKPHSR